MDYQYQFGDAVHSVQLERDSEAIRVTIGDRIYSVTVLHAHAGEVSFTVDGVTYTAFVAGKSAGHFVAIEGDVYELKQPDARRARRKHHHGEDNLTASMPGQVTKVLVGQGETVQRGQPLIVLEAMKMEIKITAPHDGRVAKVLVQAGQVVDRGQRLIEIMDKS